MGHLFTLLFFAISSATASDCIERHFRSLFSASQDRVHLFSEMPGRATKRIQIGTQAMKEIGVLVSSHHPRVQALIERIRTQGGELRLVVNEAGEDVRATSYFQYDSAQGVPYIALDPLAPLTSLEHEMAHFEDFVAAKSAFEARGLKGEDLRRHLAEIRGSSEWMQRTERHAIAKQLRAQSNYERQLGLKRGSTEVYPSSALPTIDLQYFIQLMTYPEVQALSDVLDRPEYVANATAAVMRESEALMDEALRKAILLKRSAYQRARANLSLEAPVSKMRRLDLQQFMRRQADLQGLFDEIFSWMLDRFPREKEELLRKLFDSRVPAIVSKFSERIPGGYQPKIGVKPTVP